MENKNINSLIKNYKEILKEEDFQYTYHYLMKFMGKIKSGFSKKYKDYSFGNIAPGYLDFTYFSFSNKELRNKSLRYGIVLNHKEMRFELWLMGQNKEIQEKYWDLLKNTKWNRELIEMPKYSVLEKILVENPDFTKEENLIEELINITYGNIFEIEKNIYNG